MIRIEEQEAEPLIDDGTNTSGFGILVIDASDTSSQLNLFLDLINDPCKYRGRMVYITAIGPTERPDPFLFANKFYFNENCEWFESPFTSGGLF